MNFHCFFVKEERKEREFMFASLNGNQLFLAFLWSGLLPLSHLRFFFDIEFRHGLLKTRVEGTACHDSLIYCQTTADHQILNSLSSKEIHESHLLNLCETVSLIISREASRVTNYIYFLRESTQP